jgi:hypothetical protein
MESLIEKCYLRERCSNIDEIFLIGLAGEWAPNMHRQLSDKIGMNYYHRSPKFTVVVY